MEKFIRYPFAADGDRTAIPDETQPSGEVSYEQGFGYDYSRDQSTDPLAKNTPREGMNALLYDITQAIREMQTAGVPDYITPALNGGTAYAYPPNALVRYDAGSGVKVYRSLVADNTADPSDATKWADIAAAATTAQHGLVELATTAETLAGTDTERAVTPSGLSAALSAATTKGYKAAVRVVATAPIALTGLPTIDGVALADGYRVLVTAQAAAAANGIYVAAAGAWSRTADADDGDELAPGVVVPVIGGAANGGSLWMLSSDSPVTIGVTATTWARAGGNGPPPGSIIMHSGAAAPSGYLKCNGALVSRTTYAALYAAIGTTYGAGDGSTTFKLPDLRGEFIRGFDDGRGVDSGRALGSSQADAFQGHTFGATLGVMGWDASLGSGSNNAVRLTPGTKLEIASDGVNGTPRIAAETRPRNVALLACIKY